MAAILKPFGNILNPRRLIPNGRPRIDWTHPLSNALFAAYLPGLFRGLDLGPNGYNLTTGAAVPNIAVTPEGPGSVASSGTNSGYSLAVGAKAPATLSVYLRLMCNAATAGVTTAFSFTDASTDDALGLFIDGSNPPSIQAQSENGSGGFVVGASGLLTQNVIASAGMTYVVGGNATSYFNGLANGTTAQTAIPTQTNNFSIEMGYDPANSASASNIVLICGYIWNRTLTADEMEWMHLDPYCFFLPAEAEMPALFVASASETITIDKWWQPPFYLPPKTELVPY